MSARNVAATALEETEKSLTFLCLIKAWQNTLAYAFAFQTPVLRAGRGIQRAVF